jgi:two-component system, LytTR family, response regulator
MNDKIRAIIIDDEFLAREIIKKYIQHFPDIEILGECGNGFEGIKAINEKKPDLIFLDIQMPKINGFEMLELLVVVPVVIFTTAYDQYALKAFEVNAADYLLKPFSDERFDEAIEKARIFLKNKDKNDEIITNIVKHVDSKDEFLERIVIKTGSKIVIVPVEKIQWLEAQDDYVMLYSDEGKFLKQKTMKFFEDRLNPGDFIRIHRSYIVNITRVKQIELFEKETYRVLLNNGQTLPVSKTGYSKLKEIFN